MSPTTRRPGKAGGSEDEPEDAVIPRPGQAGGPEDEPEDTAIPRPPAEPDRFESELSKAERLRREARQLDRDLWTLVGHMASALLVYGGIGYLLGRWLGHPILLLVGLVFGLVLSLGYTVWLANRGGRLHR